MVIVFYQFEPIWVSLDIRSGQGQFKQCQILKFVFWKIKYFANEECSQESNGTICFSLCGLELPEILFYWMTSPIDVML